MNTPQAKEDNFTITEYIVRQLINNTQPGSKIAGPFSSEEEANEHRAQHPGTAVFTETWLQ